MLSSIGLIYKGMEVLEYGVGSGVQPNQNHYENGFKDSYKSAKKALHYKGKILFSCYSKVLFDQHGEAGAVLKRHQY